MVSSKRQRGKQRKKNLAATRSVDGGAASTDDSGGGRYVFSPPKEIAALVRRGSSIGTAAIISDMSSLMGKNDDAGGPSLSLDVSGLLSTVLRFLKRCEHETFAGVMADVRGDMISPSMWIKILYLVNSLEPSCRLQIVQNIHWSDACVQIQSAYFSRVTCIGGNVFGPLWNSFRI